MDEDEFFGFDQDDDVGPILPSPHDHLVADFGALEARVDGLEHKCATMFSTFEARIWSLEQRVRCR